MTTTTTRPTTTPAGLVTFGVQELGASVGLPRAEQDAAVAAWSPTRYTPPLTPSFLSDGPRLIQLVERHMRSSDTGQLVRLDRWQKALLCHVLERYPLDWPDRRLRGRLRWRQVVISLGRQNGKSLIAAILALYGLLQHVPGPSVVGVATSVEQANVVYGRAEFAVRKDHQLMGRLKPSGTRGIRRRDGRGAYKVFPNLTEGLQSVPITLAIADELHLSVPAMWDSIVNGQRSKLDTLLAGITTAGDDASTLLIRLYDQGEAAIMAANPAGRFGFYVWEAPPGSVRDDDAAIMAANPAVACGRIDVETAKSDIAHAPEDDVQRYTFNRFITGSTSCWIDLDHWRANATGGVPDATNPVFAIQRTDSWEHASIVAATTLPGDRLATELVATIARPTQAALEALCRDLNRIHPGAVFVVESATLSSLGKELRDAGLEVWIMTQNEICQASAAAYAAIRDGRLQHPNDQLLTEQMPHARRVESGESWRITGRGVHHVDAVLATILACHVASTRPAPQALQLF